MSRLKLFCPDGLEMDDRVLREASEPVILPFAAADRYAKDYRLLDPLSRARTIYENRCCCNCGHPVVEPIELDDGILNRNRLPMPGTASLVGFRCQRCHNEWPAA